MSKVKDNWEEMSQDEILEEIYNESYGNIEQLQSDIEDLKEQLHLWQSIANKDRLEVELLRKDNAELKRSIKIIEDRYSTNWVKKETDNETE